MFVAHNVRDHGQDRSRWSRVGPKKGKEPRRIGNPPLSFQEYRSQHDGCWVCYGKGNNHAHDHRQCKVYEADKKAYFAAHPEKKPITFICIDARAGALSQNEIKRRVKHDEKFF